MSDIFSKSPENFAKALGGISNYVGLGLIAGPLLGSLATKLFKNQAKAAYLVSAIVAIFQLLNILKMRETLSDQTTSHSKYCLGCDATNM